MFGANCIHAVLAVSCQRALIYCYILLVFAVNFHACSAQNNGAGLGGYPKPGFEVRAIVELGNVT